MNRLIETLKLHSIWRLAVSIAARILLLFLIVVVSPSPVPTRAAGPWYVAPSGSDGNSCLSAGSPCATINGAIGKATAGDTIKVATGTYTETIVLDKVVILSGGWNTNFDVQSGNSVVEGQGQCHVVTVNTDVIATIDRFTIQNGACTSLSSMFDAVGGGIYNVGTLSLTNSQIRNNTVSYLGGGIYNISSITLTDSAVNENTVTNAYGGHSGGGGIYNGLYSTLTMNTSTVSGNVCNPNAPFTPSCLGGGINNQGTLALINSQVSNNTAQLGGGIINGGLLTIKNSAVNGNVAQYGGGIRNDSEAHIDNSTISGNTSAYGGGIENNSYMTLNSSTITRNTAGNGGGMVNISSVTLRNTILADNTFSDCWGNINSGGYNLLGNISPCSFTVSTGDLLNINPLLFGLIGSPGYHPFLRGSPAIDAGNPAGCTDHLGNPLNFDQRGIARVGRCDIGSYEYDPANDPITYFFLPLISGPRPGIQGFVTLNGNPIAGVSLEMRFYDGASWSTISTTTTGADGYYAFLNAPGLGAGQKYYVLYRNYANTPGRLWVWATRELTSYLAGSTVPIGNFDIADIPLVSPADGATVALPYTFHWTPRPATPSDTYEFDLYDPTDGDPYFYTVPPLGYVSSYTLNGRPPGFNRNVQYAWEIWVYSPDGGFGISFESRLVKFSNTGVSEPSAPWPTQPKIAPDMEDRLMR